MRGEQGLDVGDRLQVSLLSTEPERGFHRLGGMMSDEITMSDEVTMLRHNGSGPGLSRRQGNAGARLRNSPAFARPRSQNAG